MKKSELHIKITTLIIAVIGMLLVGTIVFSLVEKWSILDAFYFVTMTATTVGYGDFTPTHDLSKILTIIYSVSIVPLVLYAFSMIARYQVNAVYNKVHHLEIKQREQEEELESTEDQLKKQKKKLRETTEDLEEHEKEINKQQSKLKHHSRFAKVAEDTLRKLEKETREQKKVNKKQDLEIDESNKELELVETLVVKK